MNKIDGSHTFLLNRGGNSSHYRLEHSLNFDLPASCLCVYQLCTSSSQSLFTYCPKLLLSHSFVVLPEPPKHTTHTHKRKEHTQIFSRNFFLSHLLLVPYSIFRLLFLFYLINCFLLEDHILDGIMCELIYLSIG